MQLYKCVPNHYYEIHVTTFNITNTNISVLLYSSALLNYSELCTHMNTSKIIVSVWTIMNHVPCYSGTYRCPWVLGDPCVLLCCSTFMSSSVQFILLHFYITTWLCNIVVLYLSVLLLNTSMYSVVKVFFSTVSLVHQYAAEYKCFHVHCIYVISIWTDLPRHWVQSCITISMCTDVSIVIY